MREKLNTEHYQQAVRFAQHLNDGLKAEFLAETEARYQFEKEQLAKEKMQILQNSGKKRPLVIGAVSIILILSITVFIYWQTDRFNIVQKGKLLHQEFQQQMDQAHGSQKNDRYITNLQNQLREEPNNGELWYELGQAYALNNDFNSALICYDNARKVLGEKAAILGAMATADYYDNGQKLSEQAKIWIEKALALDANESASLLILASDGFLNNNYQQALDNWRKVLDSDNSSINRRAIIQSMEMAKQMLKGQQTQ